MNKKMDFCLFATMNVFIIMQDYINHSRNGGKVINVIDFQMKFK